MKTKHFTAHYVLNFFVKLCIFFITGLLLFFQIYYIRANFQVLEPYFVEENFDKENFVNNNC